jgi:hypothetical protein
MDGYSYQVGKERRFLPTPFYGVGIHAAILMKLHARRTIPLQFFGFCSILLTLFISACSTSGTGGTPAIPTPTPTPTPAVNSYTGQGYTINYPKDWTYKKDNHQVAGHEVPVTIFRDSLGINTIAIGVLPDPNGALSAQTVVNAAMGLAGLSPSGKNYKQVSSIADKTTIGGQTWNQTAATGDITQQGTTANVKVVGLACNYPANSPTTSLYVIVYAGPTATFDNTDSMVFQPTLKSFKFS